jgi:hypothetical protein
MYHSVELTLVTFAVALVGLIIGQLAASQLLVALLLPLAVLAIIGHFVAIMTSNRVRAL